MTPPTDEARCDRIVNDGMGEPTECGRTLPCEYHDSDEARPLIDEEQLAQALYDAHVQHVIHGYSHTNREIAREIIAAYEALDERLPR